ncbi:hypothetical protein SHI21_15770 [Bacteriovorax sp. PP10]|uniref:Uncharacterized protein n=1 Tax=Bacteriovorax antarcticus TaxID=3088717 RepID=A0ABU5VX93_9BACT|nr:hypothetical protein [Bacteriovorax sp. PP10]MEA9357688.1 hypothetical protein [Bacteriovorax sp. PP10]
MRNGSTLDLDFANDRYHLNGTSYTGIGSFITGAGASFSRATTATYYNSLGVLSTATAHSPRLDYDPNTHEPKGLLIEEARTNDMFRSAEMDNVYWLKSSITVTADAALAPDGTMSADLITTTGASNTYITKLVGTYAGGTAVTKSVYAKAGTSSKIIFEHVVSGPGYLVTTFNLSTLTVTPATGVTASIQNVGNGWYRLSATKVFANSNTTDFWAATYIDIYGTAAAGKTIYLWGAQQELGAFSTSYIPTTTAAVTRSKDNFTVPTAAWFNATTGTFVTQSYGQINSTQNGYGRVVGGDGAVNFVGFDSSLSRVGTWNGTTTLTAVGTVTASSTQSIKMAHAWDQGAGTQSVAGSRGQLSTGSYVGSWTSTNISPGGSSYNPLNAPVMRVTFFPLCLPDAGLKDYTR